MTPLERVTAMEARKLSLALCFHWANHAPMEVPLIDGEWWFWSRSSAMNVSGPGS